MLEALNVDSEQILRESNIHKMPLRVSETEGDYLKDSQTQPEQSTEVRCLRRLKADPKAEKRTSPNAIPGGTTEADRDELTRVKIAKVTRRSNATGIQARHERRRKSFGKSSD